MNCWAESFAKQPNILLPNAREASRQAQAAYIEAKTRVLSGTDNNIQASAAREKLSCARVDLTNALDKERGNMITALDQQITAKYKQNQSFSLKGI